MPQTRSAYDDLPYEGTICRQSHPDYLYRAVRLSGFAAPGFRAARVLELGCGAGLNTVSAALALPQASFTGIDLSQNHIARALRYKETLNLNNATFRQENILDFGKDGGPFDYIICHGVFSWVPGDVRRKILEICRGNLSAGGLALISFNALPGWNFNRSLREMLRYHVRGLAAPVEKTKEARTFLAALADNAAETAPGYGEFVRAEHEKLSRLPDGYFFHDLLAEENEPFYLHEFAALLEPYGLRYIADADSAAPGATLEEEQYRDYASNRRFRMAILGPAGSAAAPGPAEILPLPVENFTPHVSGKPLAFALARLQAADDIDARALAGAARQMIKSDRFMNHLVLCTDGTNDMAQICALMTERGLKGNFTLKTPGGPISESRALGEAICELVPQALAEMAKAGLLAG